MGVIPLVLSDDTPIFPKTVIYKKSLRSILDILCIRKLTFVYSKAREDAQRVEGMQLRRAQNLLKEPCCFVDGQGGFRKLDADGFLREPLECDQ